MPKSPKKRNPPTSQFVTDPAVLRGATLNTVPQFCIANPAFTEGGIRWILFNRGAELERAGAVVRNGRRVLLIPDKFIGCVLSGKQAA